jgi:hypothetical protein
MTEGSRIWRLSDPSNATFARVIRNGYWYSGREATDPMDVQLVIEWKSAGAICPDFLWPGFDDDVVVASDIGQELNQRFKGFQLVNVMQKGSPPRKRSAKPGLQVPLVQREPREYHVLWVRTFVDHDKDTTTIKEELETDGGTRTILDGIERVETEWIPDPGVLLKKRIPRVESKGLFVRREALGKYAIFRVRQWPVAIMCTQEAKDFIEENKYTNIGFKEMGNVI